MLKFLLALLLIIPVFPQSTDDNEIKFQLAVSRYGSGQYNDALISFRELATINDFPLSAAALVFTAKSELKLERLDDAQRSVIDFIRKYPGSRYMDEARLTLSKIFFEKDDLYSALRELAYLISDPKTESYRKYAKNTAKKMAAKTDPQEIEKLQLITGDEVKPFLLLLTGKSYLKHGNKLEADAAFLEIIEDFPDSDEKGEAETLLRQKIKPVPEPDIQIVKEPVLVALLPLTNKGSSRDSAPVEEILEGVKYAVSEYNNNHSEKMGLLIRNTDNSPAKIEEIGRELKQIPSIKAIIGPVFSDEVRAALRVMNNTDIPLISPTATDNDLTELNDYFFQANPDFSMRGKAMAQYIYYVENKRKIGILNAAEGYSPSISVSFANEFERLGGEIIIRETYSSKSFSLADQARRISAFIGSIDGLYIPLSDKADAPVILNELLMHNLEVNIYGNQDWFYSKGYSNFPGITDNLTFTSDHFTDFNNPEYQEFAKNFQSLASMDAGRNVLYGYDAAKYILNITSDWNENPKKLKRDMESGISLDGYHNNISFDSQRVNNYLNIVRYRDGVFELIDRFKTGTK